MNDKEVNDQISSWDTRGPEASATIADMNALQTWTAVEMAADKRRISSLEYQVKQLQTVLRSKVLIRKNIYADDVLNAMERYDHEYLEELLELLNELREMD